MLESHREILNCDDETWYVFHCLCTCHVVSCWVILNSLAATHYVFKVNQVFCGYLRLRVDDMYFLSSVCSIANSSCWLLCLFLQVILVNLKLSMITVPERLLSTWRAALTKYFKLVLSLFANCDYNWINKTSNYYHVCIYVVYLSTECNRKLNYHSIATIERLWHARKHLN